MSMLQNNDISTKLERLRDAPVAQASNDELLTIFRFLIQETAPNNGKVHWFCSQTQPLVLEAATFMLRLHAYNSKNVVQWRQRLQACLGGCSPCAKRLQEIKETSRHTYFGAFADPMLKEFYKSFATWELETILEYCKKAHVSPDIHTNTDNKSLADVPPSIVLLMLSNLHHLRDPRVISIIRSYSPDKPITNWPLDSPPAGLFLLLMDEKSEVRTWAYQQIALYKTTPLPAEQFLSTYSEVLEAATSTITSLSPGQMLEPWSAGFAFPNDPAVIWPGYCTMLRFAPVKWMRPSPSFKIDLRKVVIAHLSDTGNHFPEVLKAFLLLLHRLGPKLWAGEGEEYPQVVFDTIKNNSAYANALEVEQPNHSNWTIQWMESYVKSLSELPGLQSLFPLMMQYLCEELQHERFKNVRASAMCIAATILDTVLVECSRGALTNEPSPLLSVAVESLDIHANIFTSVAFGKAYMTDVWIDARSYSRGLVQTALRMDVKLVVHTIVKLAMLSSKGEPPTHPRVKEQLWKKTYESLLPNDWNGIASIVYVLSGIAHADDLHEGAFDATFKGHSKKEDLIKVVRGVNRALKIFRTGFSDAVSRFLDFTEPTVALGLLRKNDMTKHVMTMMFSPVESLRSPVQSLIGLALDVESRADCFCAVLQTNPDGALEGMTSVLETFAKVSMVLPEACGLSKALALCLTDVIDVLCATPDGLLHKTHFLQGFQAAGPEVQLPKWWGLMAKALTHIFQRTPRWAEYFDNEMMITWMRDALIFGRDMLAQRKVIEGSALALSPQSSMSRGKSHIGTKMVDDLQSVLLELIRWLRLTDEELLFQAFALLQSLLGCFREANVKPSQAALQKLQKHVRDARTPDPKRPQTKLDASRVDRLQDAISAFEEKEESDDDIQIISHIIKAPSERKKEKAKTRTKTEPASAKQKTKPVAASKSAKPIRPDPIRKPSAKASINNYFTTDDQRKLDAASSIPKFKASSIASSSKSAAASVAVAVARGRSKGAASEASSSAPSVAASSSDESESDEGGEKGLASLAKLQRTPTVKKPPERRQVMMLDLPGTAKNPVLERLNNRSARDEARRTGLRLKPDVTPLHRAILSWDYDADGAQPPGENLRLSSVPDRFDSEHHYRRIFEPLLLMECWAQLQQSKEVEGERYSCQILTRQYSDDWVDHDIQITDSVTKDWSLSEAEIVLLRHPGGKKGFLCKVQNYRTTMASINATLRMLASTDNGPQINTSWTLQKVLSLTTVHREYAALMGLPYYDLCPVILRPKLSEPARTNPIEVADTMKAYNLNEPQAKAILSALRTDGFSLIQGPPGTGKTSTICGLVQAFLSKRAKPATAIHAGRNSGPADKEPKKKILLCAPSNAAIDEITYRLKEGVSGSGRTHIVPQVVRVGGGKMSLAVKDVSLNYLVEQKVNADAQAKASSKDVGSDLAVLRSKLEAVKRQREQKLAEITNVHDNTARTFSLEEDIRALNKERTALTSQLDKLRDQQKSNFRALDAVSRRFRAEILQDADVICTTLAGAGHELLEPFDFEMVVIDEAAQAIELSSLIPLKYRCSRCVMVGDPQQLPPTVISTEASKYNYNQSLFVRLQKHRPDAVHLLSIQYRMHPDISVLPSRLFYGGRLLDGPDMKVKTQRPWHGHPKFGTYRFYNVLRGIEESGSSHSYKNRAEVDIAVALYNRMHQEFIARGTDITIGVVTMYKAQMLELRRAFERRFGSALAGMVDFNTVDGFQGQEKDVIILSCVRAGPGVERVGFLADVRRMNVALTRAKCSVFILGSAATLERSNGDWKAIVNDARSRSCLIDVDVSFFTSPVTASARTAVPKQRVPSKSKMLPPAPELSTPRELAAASQRPSSSHAMSGIEPTVTPAPSILPAPIPALPVLANAPVTPKPHTEMFPQIDETPPGLGQKRPAEDGQAAGPAPKRRAPPAAERPAPKPKLPPVREKKKPSIFMPSKRPGAR